MNSTSSLNRNSAIQPPNAEDDTGFYFYLRPDLKLPLTQIKNTPLSEYGSMQFAHLLKDLKQVAFIDIDHDPKIKTTDEVRKLHKISQYTMQYLMHTINDLSTENEVLDEKKIIYEKKLQENRRVIQEQENKIKQLRDAVQEKKELHEHLKILLEKEMDMRAQNKKRIDEMVERLKTGSTRLDSDEVPEARKLRREIEKLEHKFNNPKKKRKG